MAKTLKATLAREDRGIKSTSNKRGSDEPSGFEAESPEAQAALLRMFPYLREQHPELARSLGYSA